MVDKQLMYICLALFWTFDFVVFIFMPIMIWYMISHRKKNKSNVIQTTCVRCDDTTQVDIEGRKMLRDCKLLDE